MEGLTKEKAIELHRKMWNWIADETEKQGRIVSKVEAFAHFYWPDDIYAHCWCCEYDEQKINSEFNISVFYRHRCYFCPIIWRSKYITCISIDSPFHYWDNIYEKGDKADWYDVQDAIKYAREIANLPERKD